jgi:glyoxylase-like metal-dependent hydrolase (beta-lactamase superfamily II)
MSNQPDWTEPGAYAVCEGVHRIPLPLPMDGLRAVNVYVIETEHGLTLVDGGWAIELARKQLEDSLRCLGHTPRDITSFLVTHAHRDHYTQAVAIRSEFGRATVALGLGDKPTLDLVNSALDENPFVRRLYACGAVEVARAWAQSGTGAAPDVAVWQPPDTWLEGDQVIEVGSRRLRAVPTPGHTAGHFVFADLEAGLLFAGDHVLPTITPSVGFEAANESEPLRDYLDSLVRVRALPDLRLLPAHGSVTTSSHARVDELLQHHESRLQLSLAAVGSGRHTPYEVASALPWTRRERSFAELDVFNAGMAVMETRVHLDLLAIRGRLEREQADQTWFYYLRTDSAAARDW